MKECGYCPLDQIQFYNYVKLDEKTCTLNFSSNLRNDVIVEIQIEDYETESSTIPKSSTTLQFSTRIDQTIYKCPTVNQSQLESICNNVPYFTEEVLIYT